MTTLRYVLSKEIEDAKCRSCSELAKDPDHGYYCKSERQRLDLLDRSRLDDILLRCCGPYRRSIKSL